MMKGSNEIQFKTVKVDGDTTYNYFSKNGFEVRNGIAKNYNYNKDDSKRYISEIRVRNTDPEQIEALLDKIKEWLS